MSNIFSYILSYDPQSITKKRLIRYLKESVVFNAWYLPFDGTVLVVSEEEADTISEDFLGTFEGCDHVIVDVQDDEPDYSGWLDDEAWEYLGSPEDFS